MGLNVLSIGYQSHLLHPACGHQGSPHLSPRFSPCDFLSRCKFGTLTPHQPITLLEFFLLRLSSFPFRYGSQNKRSDPVKNRTHDSALLIFINCEAVHSSARVTRLLTTSQKNVPLCKYHYDCRKNSNACWEKCNTLWKNCNDCVVSITKRHRTDRGDLSSAGQIRPMTVTAFFTHTLCGLMLRSVTIWSAVASRSILPA